MMTEAENDLLTRTGPGTPCGEWMRRYWQPVALSEELPLGGAPRPVRLLGEELVLFRDERGRAGLLGLHCSHRGADLSYGRVEDGGLRCIYHGWLYDIQGSCLDQPGEPGGGEHRGFIHHPAYRCREQGRVIFAYLGSGEPPLLPGYEFLAGSEEHLFVKKLYHECNYLQASEGNYDPVHVGFLHRNLERGHLVWTAPSTVEMEITDFGFRQYALRPVGSDKIYLRVFDFIYPGLSAFAIAPPNDKQRMIVNVNWHVPIDDTHHWKYVFFYDREKPIDREAVLRDHFEMTADYKPVRNRTNRYLQDRESLKTKSFSGVGSHFQSHDVFITESLGTIQDRTREHLTTSDRVIVAARKLLLKAIMDVQEGREAPHVVREPRLNRFSDLVVIGEVIPSSIDWKDHIKKDRPEARV